MVWITQRNLSRSLWTHRNRPPRAGNSFPLDGDNNRTHLNQLACLGSDSEAEKKQGEKTTAFLQLWTMARSGSVNHNFLSSNANLAGASLKRMHRFNMFCMGRSVFSPLFSAPRDDISRAPRKDEEEANIQDAANQSRL
jgi:hypothetical protein